MASLTSKSFQVHTTTKDTSARGRERRRRRRREPKYIRKFVTNAKERKFDTHTTCVPHSQIPSGIFSQLFRSNFFFLFFISFDSSKSIDYDCARIVHETLICRNIVCSLQSQSPICSCVWHLYLVHLCRSFCFVAFLSAIRRTVYPSDGVLNYTQLPEYFLPHIHRAASLMVFRSMVKIPRRDSRTQSTAPKKRTNKKQRTELVRIRVDCGMSLIWLYTPRSKCDLIVPRVLKTVESWIHSVVR